ncbi:flippase [Treponema rectale]|uniref:Flippase n=1 Tax=Treponema rectale TaxID=744512 RepID=A0A840SG47_9SPIR|nr:flippase [Treponema rectale]MBB5218411.1 O-antigen/teichoic acid export membrane protein [Treponema rectale]QOS39897.1 flippase [Treponema rectale]
MKQKSLKTNAFFSFLKAFMDIVFPVISFPYASRILSPAGIGRINFSNSITAYFAMIAGLGVTTYATREVARIRENKNELNKFCKEILIINFFSSIAAYVLFAFSLIFVRKFDSYRILLILSSSTVLFRALSMSWFYAGFENFKLITIRTTVFQVISLVFLFVFVRESSDLVEYMIFGLITPIGCNAFNFIYAMRLVDLRCKCRLEFKKHLKQMFVFWGMSFVTTIYETLDSSFLGFLSTDSEVGYYSAAIKINRMVLMLLVSISGILLPRLSLYAEKKDDLSFYRLIHKSFGINFIIAFPCAAGLFVLSEPIVRLFSGEQYLPAVVLMQLMTLLVPIISLSNLIGGQILPALKKEKLCFISYITGASVNLVFNSALIPLFGAFGAGIASVIAESCVLLVQLVFFAKISSEPKISSDVIKNLLHSLFSTLIMSVFVFFVMRITEGFGLVLQIFISIFAGCIVYCISLLLLRNSYIHEWIGIIRSTIRKKY